MVDIGQPDFIVVSIERYCMLYSVQCTVPAAVMLLEAL